MLEIVLLKRLYFWQVMVGMVGWSLVAIPLVFGGTALTDDELDTVGAAGSVEPGFTSPSPALPLSEEELQEEAAKGTLPQVVWPFQFLPDFPSNVAPNISFKGRLSSSASSSLFPSYDPNNPNQFGLWGRPHPLPPSFK